MTIKKPDQTASSEYRSAKWDEITKGRDFREQDAPTLELLCQWYEVIDQCIAELNQGGGLTVSYINDVGDEKAMPQLSTMKQASAEIRALNKQLGINDEAAVDKQSKKETALHVIQGNRKRKSGAAHSA